MRGISFRYNGPMENILREICIILYLKQAMCISVFKKACSQLASVGYAHPEITKEQQ
jgi:hypothetical protein